MPRGRPRPLLLLSDLEHAGNTKLAEPSFALFSDLPRELRLLICKCLVLHLALSCSLRGYVYEEVISSTRQFHYRLMRANANLLYLLGEFSVESRIVHLRQRRLAECRTILRQVPSDRLVPNSCGVQRSRYSKCHDCSVDDYDAHSAVDMEIGNMRSPMTGFLSELPIPPIVLACKESHEVASRFYTACFSSMGSFAQTYFSFEHDTLLLDEDTYSDCLDEDKFDLLLPCFCKDELAKVQNLAVSASMVEEGFTAHRESLICDVLAVFGNVTSFTLVNYDYTPMYGGALVDPVNIVFVDHEDFRRELYLLKHPDFHDTYASMDMRWAGGNEKLDLEMFADAMLAKAVPGMPMPMIQERIMISPDMKAKLGAIQQAHKTNTPCFCLEVAMSEMFLSTPGR